MGWETRQRGGIYYYRKYRIGACVVSRYLGAGTVASLSAEFDESERKAATDRRARERFEIEEGAGLDAALEAIGAALVAAAACEMVAAGCHNHNGEWRVIRGGKG